MNGLQKFVGAFLGAVFNAAQAPAAPPQPLKPLPQLDFSTSKNFEKGCAVLSERLEAIAEGVKQVETLIASPGFAMDSSNKMLPALRSFLDTAQDSLHRLEYIILPDAKMQGAQLMSKHEISFSDFERNIVPVGEKKKAVKANLDHTHESFETRRKNAAAEISDAREDAIRQAISGTQGTVAAPDIAIRAAVKIKI